MTDQTPTEDLGPTRAPAMMPADLPVGAVGCADAYDPETHTILRGWGSVALVDRGASEEFIDAWARTLPGPQADPDRTGERRSRLLSYLVTHKHTSPLEFGNLTFYVRAPLFVTNQWMRHRTGKTSSFNELSFRHTASEQGIKFWVPEEMRTRDENSRFGSKPMEWNEDALGWWLSSMRDSYRTYNKLTTCAGIHPEQARAVLGTGLMTSFIYHVDLNNLAGFLRLRLANDAQPEIQTYARAVLKLAEGAYPTIMNAVKVAGGLE